MASFPAMEHPLKIWRTERRHTLREAAEILGVSRSHLQEIETWQSEPTVSMAARLSDATKIAIRKFIVNGEKS